MSESADGRLRLGDGRSLGFRIHGDPAGVPLLFLHGTPGSRLEFGIGHAAGRERGLAIIAPDRWGYGLSDCPPNPTLAGFAADAAMLMDHLGHRSFAVGGVSGGAPYAAAVAACMPARVTTLALVSPVGPIAGDAGATSLTGMQRFAFCVLPARPNVAASIFRAFRFSLATSPRFAARLATLRGSRTDKALISQPQLREKIMGSLREGLRRGLSGPTTDLAIFSKPWQIDLAQIRASARVWIGTADVVVPRVAALTLAQRIAGCILTEPQGQGHFWVASNYAEVLDWIREVGVAGRAAARV